MESTLQWRDNKIKALEAQRDYFMKKASEQVSLSKSQVFVKRVFCVLFLRLKMGFYSHFDKTFYFSLSLSSSDFLRRIILWHNFYDSSYGSDPLYWKLKTFRFSFVKVLILCWNFGVISIFVKYLKAVTYVQKCENLNCICHIRKETWHFG